MVDREKMLSAQYQQWDISKTEIKEKEASTLQAQEQQQGAPLRSNT